MIEKLTTLVKSAKNKMFSYWSTDKSIKRGIDNTLDLVMNDIDIFYFDKPVKFKIDNTEYAATRLMKHFGDFVINSCECKTFKYVQLYLDIIPLDTFLDIMSNVTQNAIENQENNKKMMEICESGYKFINALINFQNLSGKKLRIHKHDLNFVKEMLFQICNQNKTKMIDILFENFFTATIVMGIFGGLVLGIESIINRFPNVKEKISNMFAD